MSVDLAALEELAAATSSEEPPSSPSSPSSTQRDAVHLEPGETYQLTLDARDRRAYALNAERYKLPPFTIGPEADVLKLELLTVFSAWYAARHRLGLVSIDWPRWNALVIELDVLPDAPEVAAHPLARGVD